MIEGLQGCTHQAGRADVAQRVGRHDAQWDEDAPADRLKPAVRALELQQRALVDALRAVCTCTGESVFTTKLRHSAFGTNTYCIHA